MSTIKERMEAGLKVRIATDIGNTPGNLSANWKNLPLGNYYLHREKAQWAVRIVTERVLEETPPGYRLLPPELEYLRSQIKRDTVVAQAINIMDDLSYYVVPINTHELGFVPAGDTSAAITSGPQPLFADSFGITGSQEESLAKLAQEFTKPRDKKKPGGRAKKRITAKDLEGKLSDDLNVSSALEILESLWSRKR
jgi:hypothetical protein